MTRLVGDSLTVVGAPRRADDEVNHLLGERALGAASERIRHRRPKTPSVPVHETRHETRRGAVRRLRVSPPPAEGAVSRGAAHAHREPRSRSREKFASPTFARGGDRVSIEAVKRRARDADARGIDTLRGVEGGENVGNVGKVVSRRDDEVEPSKVASGVLDDDGEDGVAASALHRDARGDRAATAGDDERASESRVAVVFHRGGDERAEVRAEPRLVEVSAREDDVPRRVQPDVPRGGERAYPPREAREVPRQGRGARAAALHHSHRARAATQTLAPRRAESRRERERRLAHQVDVAGARPGRPEPERADQAETLTLRAERAVAQHERARHRRGRVAAGNESRGDGRGVHRSPRCAMDTHAAHNDSLAAEISSRRRFQLRPGASEHSINASRPAVSARGMRTERKPARAASRCHDAGRLAARRARGGRRAADRAHVTDRVRRTRRRDAQARETAAGDADLAAPRAEVPFEP